jgi:hypothetical protein
MNSEPSEADSAPTGYGTPEMQALLEEAEASLRRSQEFWADAGITPEEIDAALAEAPEEIRSAYEQLLRDEREDAAAAWRAERKELMRRLGVESPAAPGGRPARTRLRL